jgi:hypothetical protein
VRFSQDSVYRILLARDSRLMDYTKNLRVRDSDSRPMDYKKNLLELRVDESLQPGRVESPCQRAREGV